MSNVKEIEAWVDGIYKGIEIANNLLEEQGYNLRIKVPTKEKIMKMFARREDENDAD